MGARICAIIRVMRKITFLVGGVLLAGLAAADAASSPLWLRPGVLPETRFDANAPQTACKWLWNADEAIGPGSESFFRRTFDLSAPTVRARLDFHADDRGEAYLNGRRLGRGFDDLAKCAVMGRNVLAVHVRNAMGPGGTIFSARFFQADGTETRIVSDRLCRGAAQAPTDWTSPNFDDAHWKPALEQGDAMLQPWSHLRDYLGIYGTDEERAAINALHKRRLSIPETIAAEPEPVCSVVYREAMPFIRVNGKDFEPNLNLAGAKTPFALTANMKTHAVAFPFHELQFGCSEYETAAGKYDFTAMDVEARRLLHFIPDAYLFLRIKLDLPKWCAAHPKECIGYGDGSQPGDEFKGTPVRPSAASRPYRAEVTRFFDQLGAFVRAQPWGRRVVALRPCWGVYTEWHTYGMYNAPDTGPAMTAAFQRFANGRYAGGSVPSPADRRRAAFLLDPEKDAKVLDYHRCMSDETCDLMQGVLRDVKRNFPGRLAGCYCAYSYTSFPPEGQNCRYDRLMAMPELDFCSCPASYTHEVRRPGGSYMQRAVPDAFRRHGKLLFLEDDMRFHHVRQWVVKNQYCTKTPEESAAVMRRNWLVKLFDVSGIQLCDPFNGVGRRMNTFDHPSILGAMADAAKAVAQAGPVPAESGNEILVVSDVDQRFRWTGARSAHPLLRNLSALLPHFLQTSGAAVDQATLADYLAFDYPHRLVYVMDACNLSPADREALARKTSRPGVTAFRFALPDAPETAPANAPALSLPASVADWRTIFQSHGAHLYAEAGNWLRRRGNLLAYATRSAGRHRIVLKPGETGATELFSGRRFAGNILEFETAIPQTWLFKVD